MARNTIHPRWDDEKWKAFRMAVAVGYSGLELADAFCISHGHACFLKRRFVGMLDSPKTEKRIEPTIPKRNMDGCRFIEGDARKLVYCCEPTVRGVYCQKHADKVFACPKGQRSDKKFVLNTEKKASWGFFG